RSSEAAARGGPASATNNATARTAVANNLSGDIKRRIMTYLICWCDVSEDVPAAPMVHLDLIRRRWPAVRTLWLDRVRPSSPAFGGQLSAGGVDFAAARVAHRAGHPFRADPPDEFSLHRLRAGVPVTARG